MNSERRRPLPHSVSFDLSSSSCQPLQPFSCDAAEGYSGYSSPSVEKNASGRLAWMEEEVEVRRAPQLHCLPQHSTVDDQRPTTNSYQRHRRQRSNSFDANMACPTTCTTTTEQQTSNDSQRKSTRAYYDWIKNSKKLSRCLAHSLYKIRKSSDLSGGGKTNDRKFVETLLPVTTALHRLVERQDVAGVQQLLFKLDVIEINQMDGDDLTALDVALLVGNSSISKLLLMHGARALFTHASDGEGVPIKLANLYQEALSCVKNLKLLASSPLRMLNGSSQRKTHEQLSEYWEARATLFYQMKATYDNYALPMQPTDVKILPSGGQSLLVLFNRIQIVDDTQNGFITRFKVEWSRFENFAPLVGQCILPDPCCCQYDINGLESACDYYVRVSAGNIKGFGPPSYSLVGVPSNWREVDDVKPRWDNQIHLLDELLVNVKNLSLSHECDEDPNQSSGPGQMATRKPATKRGKGLQNLFSSSGRFQRSLKRGVYVAAVVHHEGRVLVTDDGRVPMVEVEDAAAVTNACLTADYHWLMKVACTWKDVQRLIRKLDRNSIGLPETLLFRYRLLQAVSQLQSSVGLRDLGQFHREPIKDSSGSIVFVAVRHVTDVKNSKKNVYVQWTSAEKLQPTSSSCIAYDSDTTAFDLVATVSRDLIRFRGPPDVAGLARGLYLVYLKLYSSVDRICIATPRWSSDMLPHVKIRDCPNVTREEWEYLHQASQKDSLTQPSPASVEFMHLLSTACRCLLNRMEVDESEWPEHRLHVSEVIELGGSDVSLLVLLPAAHNICAAPGHVDLHHACAAVPLQAFEINHMQTYAREFVCRYARLSSLLEVDLLLVQQATRQAFTSDELASAKRLGEHLHDTQTKVNECWRQVRWTGDVIAQARDRSRCTGLLPVRTLLSRPSTTTSSQPVSICDENLDSVALPVDPVDCI